MKRSKTVLATPAIAKTLCAAEATVGAFPSGKIFTGPDPKPVPKKKGKQK